MLVMVEGMVTRVKPSQLTKALSAMLVTVYVAPPLVISLGISSSPVKLLSHVFSSSSRLPSSLRMKTYRLPSTSISVTSTMLGKSFHPSAAAYLSFEPSGT